MSDKPVTTPLVKVCFSGVKGTGTWKRYTWTEYTADEARVPLKMYDYPYYYCETDSTVTVWEPDPAHPAVWRICNYIILPDEFIETVTWLWEFKQTGRVLDLVEHYLQDRVL